jgi:hypothetical protein
MQHVNILASDEFEGRAPPPPGGNSLKRWHLEAQFAALGIRASVCICIDNQWPLDRANGDQ